MLRMAQEIAQSDGKNDNRSDRCQRKREEQQTCPVSMSTYAANTPTHDLQDIVNSAMVSSMVSASATVSSGLSDEGRPAARKRRSRRGRNMHRHRLSKHRRDQRARSLKNVMGAPRNDNEYLMSQYNQGLQLGQGGGELSDSRVSSYHHPSPSQEELFLPPVQGCFSPPPSQQDDVAFLPLSPGLSSPEGSGSSRSSTSDYSSLPGTPNEEGFQHHQGYRELFLTSHHQLLPDCDDRTDQLESGCGVVIDGTDEDFLRRNFEEEYADSITRGLEEASREELITKCMALMEKLKELEERRCSRGSGSSRVSWDARVSC